jgi:phosphoglycerate dehydrogenase-like enzyme
MKVAVASKILGIQEALMDHLKCFPELNNQLQLEFQNFKDCEILLGEPALCAQLLTENNLNNIKWIQSTFAGVEALVSFSKTITVTRLGGILSKSMAQYCITWITIVERKILTAMKQQSNRIWDSTTLKYRPNSNLTVGILGYGDIGSAIGDALLQLGFNVLGLKRQATVASHTTTDVLKILVESDYIINCLPCTDATVHYLDDKLHYCQRRPCFINIGRGSVISEMVLLEGLEKGFLSSAVLDVFENEPLDSSSLLWHHPRVYITPHVAATTMPSDIVNVFFSNYHLFITGKKMKYLVESDRQY